MLLKKQKQMLIVFGSPRDNGSTRTLVSAFTKDFIDSGGWEITEIDAYRQNALPCTGCKECAKKEKCAFDDLNDFDKKLRRCDLLVWASPIYNYSFPAPLKAILDRSQRYFEAYFSLGKKPCIKKPRTAVLLLAMGSEDEFGVETAQYQLRRAFSVMNTELIGCVVWKSTDLENKYRTSALVDIHKLVKKLLNENGEEAVKTKADAVPSELGGL